MTEEGARVLAMKDRKPKVAEEVAQAEFERFCETMDLDIDQAHMDAEDKASLEDARRRIVRAMMRGKLVVNNDGEPVLSPSDGGESITFRQLKGAHYMAIDKKKVGHNVERTHAMLAEQTRQSPQRFANMDGPDYKVCTAIITLFVAG